MKWLAMTCALLIVALAVVAGWMAATRQFDPEPIVPAGLGSAILGIELASSAAEAHALFRDPMGCHNRDVFRGQIHEDWYFIGIYWALLSGLGGLLAFRESAGWRVLAAIVVLMVTGAAIFDVLENRGILAMIDRIPEELDDSAALKTRTASLTKWGLSFAAMGPISLVFFGRKSVGRAGPAFATLAGTCLLLGSILGLVGLVYNPAISWAVLAISPGMVLAFLVLAITPEIL